MKSTVFVITSTLNQTSTIAAYFHVKAADAYTQLISSDFKLPKNSADTTDNDDVIDLFR